MSLFGTSPPQNINASTTTSTKPDRKSQSLFGSGSDDTNASATSTTTRNASSLFVDENTYSEHNLNYNQTPSPSPWGGIPTPKKAARQDDLVKSLLPPSDVPESFIDFFDAVLDSKERVGVGQIGLNAVRKILRDSGLTVDNQRKIFSIVVGASSGSGGLEGGGQVDEGRGIGRNEFNVLLALIGLGQQGEDLTLDGVDERRRALHTPKISYFEELKSEARLKKQAYAKPSQAAITPPTGTSPKETNSSRPARMRQDSFSDHDPDPWGSSTVSPKPPMPSQSSNVESDGIARGREDQLAQSARHISQRTTSAFTTQGEDGTKDNRPPTSSDQSGANGGNDWQGYNGASQRGFGNQANLEGRGGGFGDPGDGGDDDQDRSDLRRNQSTTGASLSQSRGNDESITVTMLPEKEGMFMFQHRNYEVKSVRRGITVIRRYSDFVWLLDCLHKKYPFRRLPLLPPKRLAVNGTHLAADASSFLEKRRRGLVRFCNALIQHPVLRQEQLVTMFLTVPSDLSSLRKQASASLVEEFSGRMLPPELEESLPESLTETFNTVRMGVKRSAEIYIQLCTLAERLSKRNLGLAADSLRFSLALDSLSESSMDTYAMETNEVPLLNEGIQATAKHLSTSQGLLEEEAHVWDEALLEDIKRQRDTVVGMRDLFERQDRLARDNIPQLERRVAASNAKLESLRNRADSSGAGGGVKAGELEKLETSIIQDKESIVAQHARGVFIRECVRDELRYFVEASVPAVGRLVQDWSGERVKFAELQAGCWRGLVDEVEGMHVSI